MRVLVVENGEVTTKELRTLFAPDGHEVDAVAVFDEALQLLHAIRYELIVIDIDITVGDVPHLITTIRRAGYVMPMLVLAPSCDDPRIARAIEVGADECVKKPVSAGILLAQVRAEQKRVLAARDDELSAGDVTLSRGRRTIHGIGKTLKLTVKEFALLEVLMSQPNVMVPRSELLERVWGYKRDPGTGVLDVALSRVRRKLEDCSRDVTVSGVRGHGVILSIAAANHENDESYLKSS